MVGWFIYSGYFLNDAARFVIDRFTEEFEKRGCPLKFFRSNEIMLYCGADGTVRGGSRENPDFAVFWDKDVALAKMLEKKGVRLYNSASVIETCDSKILTHIALSGNGIAMPETVFAPLVFNNCEETDGVFIDNLLKILDFPIVVKEAAGSFGSQVYLARDVEELKALRKKLLHLPHLYQKFVGSSAGADMRVIVLNGKAIASMRRRNRGDFRSNIELGGEAEACELSESFKRAAEKAAAVLKAGLCGVDLLTGADGGPLLCEVNSNPYFKGITACTGINVAGLYADYILRRV